MNIIPRHLLEKHFAGDQRMILAMEQQSQTVNGSVEATAALKDATVIVLSPNGDFANERVLHLGPGIQMEVTDDAVKLSVDSVVFSQNYPVTLVARGTTTLLLPLSGELVSSIKPRIDPSTLGAYVDDAAAAAAGVPVGGLYRNSAATSQLMVRVA